MSEPVLSLSVPSSSPDLPAEIIRPIVIPKEDYTVVREWLRSKRSPLTRKTYGREICVFYAWSHRTPLRELTLTMLQDYAEVTAYLHPEPATQAKKLATVKSLLTFAHSTGKISVNVGKALQLPLGKDTLSQRILSQSQVQRLLFTAEQMGNQRNYVLLLLLYGSGIRCAELCGLTWADVQETSHGGQITVLGKRQKTRSIVLHPTVWQALQDFRPADADADDSVFQSRQTTRRRGKTSRQLTGSQVWRIVTTIAKEAGIKGVSTHWLRHAHATHAMEKNTPLKVIQETMGHADLRTPSRYQHVRPETSSSLALDL